MAQVYGISAFTVEVVFDLKHFVGLGTFEGFAGDDDSTAFVFCCAEAGCAAGDFPGLFGGDDLFPL